MTQSSSQTYLKASARDAGRYAATLLWPTVTWAWLGWGFSLAANGSDYRSGLVGLGVGAYLAASVLTYGIARAMLTREVPASFHQESVDLERELGAAAEKFQRDGADRAVVVEGTTARRDGEKG